VPERMLCAIPARGGSKRLPRKNVRNLAGKPMIAHSIEIARQSGIFDAVYVCTDDREIADVALSYGAAVPFLMPADLCGDLVASHLPCQRLAAYLAEQGISTDSLVCLQPTSPLRTVDDLQSAVNKFQTNAFDFVVSVTPVDPHYFHWVVAPKQNGFWNMYFGAQFLKERPLLPPVFRPNGSIKIGRLHTLAQVSHFFGERLGVVETPEDHSVHVAAEFDLKLCELILAEREA
jgi:CMP-N,N'-diacetyllegionaminic acid synthase